MLRTRWFRALLVSASLLGFSGTGWRGLDGHARGELVYAPVETAWTLPASYVLPTSYAYVYPTAYVAPSSYVATSYAYPTSYGLPVAYETAYEAPAYYSSRRRLIGGRRFAGRPVYATTTSSYYPTTYMSTAAAYTPTTYLATAAYYTPTTYLPTAAYTPTTYLPTTYAYPSVYYPSSYVYPTIYDYPIVATMASASPCLGEAPAPAPAIRTAPAPAPAPAQAPAERSPSSSVESVPAAPQPRNVPADENAAPAEPKGGVRMPEIPAEPGLSIPNTPAPADREAVPATPPAAAVPGRQARVEDSAIAPPVEATPPAPATANPLDTTFPPADVRREARRPIFGRPGTLVNRNVLEGKVISGDTLRAEEGVQIILSNRNNAAADRVATSDAFGRYAVRLTDGEWTVKVVMPSGNVYAVSQLTIGGGRIIDDLGRNIPSLTITR